MIAGLETLKAASKRRIIDVEIPELEATFRLQSLTAREQQQLEMSFIKGTKLIDLDKQKTRLLSMMLVDEQGNQLLGLERAAELEELDAFLVNRLHDAALTLTGLSASVEAAAKN